MKNITPFQYLVVLILVIVSEGNSQNLPDSRQSSYYTFIYRISNEQALTLYRDMWKFDDSFLNNFHDFFPSDSTYQKRLPAGHYIFLTAEQSDLRCELESVDNVEVRLLNNHRDLIFVLYDNTGKEVPDADVRIGSKKIPYDRKTATYRLMKSNHKGIVQVSWRNHTSFFEINRRYNRSLARRTAAKAIHTFPLNHLLSPILYIKKNVKNVVSGSRIVPPGIYYRIERVFEHRHRTGYVAFNKPQYKPRDTVRLKAFITTEKGRPVKRNTDVYIAAHYPDVYNRKIATVKAFRKGAYACEFILHDSLQLYLDRNYAVEFRDKKGRRLISDRFRYEDYELKQNSYTVRAVNEWKGRGATLFLKGMNSNNLPLYDVRVEVLLRPSDVSQYFEKQLFIPDTLWFYQTKLDAIGETKIAIPDSVMPPVRMTYEAVVSFVNAENERVSKVSSLTYNAQAFPVDFTLEQDTLVLSVADSVLSSVNRIALEGAIGDRKFLTRYVSLPHRERINPLAEKYSMHYNGSVASINLAQYSDDLKAVANRTGDSLFVDIVNPRRLTFRYFFFQNQKLIREGSSETLTIRQPAHRADNYSLSVQFVWGGKAVTREYPVDFDKKELAIHLTHPALVYPGQKAGFAITVKDAFGKPVRNVDLTAYSITKKFPSPDTPLVPDFLKTKRRVVFNEFSEDRESARISRSLDYHYWKRTLGLDTLAYYRFLFPDSGYFENRIAADMAQFAPFVVGYGSLYEVYVVYVDDQPVYYSGVGNVVPYSFHAGPGEHQVKLRLRNALLTVNNVRIDSAQKLIFSVDRYRRPDNCTVTPMPSQFTDEELAKLSRHFALVQQVSNQSGAFIRQGDVCHLLEPHNSYYGNRELTGPFYPGKATYLRKDGHTVPFNYEPFYRYQFNGSMLRLRPAKVVDLLKTDLTWRRTRNLPFHDEAYTPERIKAAYWNPLREIDLYRLKQFPESVPAGKNSGKLILGYPSSVSAKPGVVATFVVNISNPADYYIFPSTVAHATVSPGMYHAVLILDNEQYVKADSIAVSPNGWNYYDLKNRQRRSADSLSNSIMKLISDWSHSTRYSSADKDRQLQAVRTTYYQQQSANYSFSHSVSGYIVDESGRGLPGVNVIIKGLPVGTITDLNGYYVMGCPENATLVFSFVGYETKEIPIGQKSSLDVAMHPDIQMLEEVFTVGYGEIQTEVLHGRLPGVYYRKPGLKELADGVRGAAAVESGTPLVILDGIVVSLDDVDESKITAIDVLKGPSATAIYGSRGANGVILISTRPGADAEYLREISRKDIPAGALEDTPGNRLRRNFRDYAFWKPDLTTDENGKAEFEATFPDDITGWNAYVLGMGSRRRTGQTSSTIQSYKPIVAQVAQPEFLIEGDTTVAIGKITNYTRDKTQWTRRISINGTEIRSDLITLENSRIDSIRMTATNEDSLAVEYAISDADYKDGELRKIPVYPRGTMETTGIFVPLNNDTTFTLNLRSDSGPVNLSAQADLIDVLLDEVTFLKNYRYECNEQLASRLRALLIGKQVMEHRREPFKDDHEVRKILRKLVSRQNKEGGWSWWMSGESELWITLHVARGLEMAERQGYASAYNKEQLVNYLASELSRLPVKEQLPVFSYLLEQGLKVNIKEIADSIRQSSTAALHDRLMVERLLQLSGEKVSLDWIRSQRSETVKGNYYWGEESGTLLDNSVLNTLIVYQILMKENAQDKDLHKIRNFFMETKGRNWRNTYESSLLLEAMMPALIVKKHSPEGTKVQLTGRVNKVIETFPFELSASGAEDITIIKTGESPVYFSAWQERWNNTPEKRGDDLVVTTFFKDSVKQLTAGRPVTLNVKVAVKRDAQYVMIEVPIPAGCSYNSKPQPRSGGEVHREYYHHKTVIFCRSLKKGLYSYTIDLLPRYAGRYTLNPAVIESMYLPVLSGRDSVKEITVSD